MIEKAFESWNDPESNRRLSRIKLLMDVTDDYEPQRQVRASAMKRRRPLQQTSHTGDPVKPKRPKANAIKCANRCGKSVSSDDPMQINAILCCHQHDESDWVDEEESCRRWLCDFCRIKLAISTETNAWFCDDHCDMHQENEQCH